jgi:AcrR family transcriptional regulator
MSQVAIDHPIIDAAEGCFQRNGVRRTTVEDVAVAAGVARVTVYRQIGGRGDLVRLVLLRTVDRHLERLAPRLIEKADLGEALVELVMGTVGAARRDDLLLLYASEERGMLGGPVPGMMDPLFERFGAVVEELVSCMPGNLRSEVTSGEAGEWLLRVIISFLTIESSTTKSVEATYEMVGRLVMPALIESFPKTSCSSVKAL